jgi:hypothetical protein
MLLIAGTLLLGIVAGLAMGGSLRKLGEVHFRWWGLAFLGLALQIVPVPSRPGNGDHVLGVGLLVASYVVLLVFVMANIRRPGFAIIAAGFTLNALVIAVNGGMPVSGPALRTAASSYQRAVEQLTVHGGAKHHLERPSDELVGLSDILPVGAPVSQVLSVGDILWLAGAAWVVARAMTDEAQAAPASHPDGSAESAV